MLTVITFLARPLAERQALAKDMRRQSEARKHLGVDYGDVDADAARQWLTAAGAPVLIHGHTHKPALHDLGHGLARWVLSDWDAQANSPRAEVRWRPDSGRRSSSHECAPLSRQDSPRLRRMRPWTRPDLQRQADWRSA